LYLKLDWRIRGVLLQ